MILNYQAFTHPGGYAFLFSAIDDEDAKRILMQHLAETKQFRASIYRWVDGDCDYSSENEIKVGIPEQPRIQQIEYKMVTRYVQWIKFSGVASEEDFQKAARLAAETWDKLPEREGYQKTFNCTAVHFTDDERYQATDILEVGLFTTEHKNA